MKILKLPHTFKIYPARGSRLFYKVNIWSTKKEMFQHLNWIPIKELRGCAGTCSTYKAYGKDGKVKPVLGEINLLKDHLWVENVSHELTHAAFGYIRRKGLSLDKNGTEVCMPVDCDEEKFCYALGFMMKQITRKLNRLKLW